MNLLDEITLANVAEAVRYKAPGTPEIAEKHEAMAQALEDFVTAILTHAPEGSARRSAVTQAFAAKFWTSAAIANDFPGR